jgi:integrase
LLANALGRSTCVAREWKPARVAAGIEPLRRIYDPRHTFATFALRAGISTFDLSRYGRQPDDDRPTRRTERRPTSTVDATWTADPPAAASKDNGNISQAGKPEAL